MAGRDRERRGRIPSRRTASTLLALGFVGCEDHAIRVELLAEGYEYPSEVRAQVQSIADLAVKDARGLLPTLPTSLVLKVNLGTDVIEETGETGTWGLPATVYWTVDPGRPGGVQAIAAKHLRGALFHELHHMVRDAKIERKTLLDDIVTEGLATAFERDSAGSDVPWGRYPDDVKVWTQEVLALPNDADRGQWMSRHPDGRRWIGYRVGTYLVDRAVRTSKQSPATLVHTTTEEIIRLATLGME